MDIAEQIDIDGGRLRVRPARPLRQFLRTDFEVSYEPELDLASIPPQIRLLPFVWNVAPIVWAADLDLTVDVLDARVAQSLDSVRDELRVMYPSIGWRGTIRPRTVVETPDPEPTEFTTAALFSGGVDSIWTALRYSGDQLLLVSVWGADVTLTDRGAWNRVIEGNRRFAANHARGVAVARSNMRDLDYLRLRLISKVPGWWPYVQHGMALAGLTAPLLYQHGIPVLHIASTYTSAFATSWGSLPRLDDLVSLGTAQVHHDSYELSRQDKIERIVSFYREHDIAPTELRVCNFAERNGGANCEECEKCVRTMVGVLMAGGDPAAYGFPRFKPSLLDQLPANFAEFRYPFSAVQVFMWRDMQDHLPPQPRPANPFWEFLRGYDFERYRRDQPARPKAPRRLLGLGARMPGLYGLGRRAKRRLSGR